MTTAYLGIGSNMGDPLANCIFALERLACREGIELLRCSSFYRTEPVGLSPQEWFVNAVVEISTSLRPRPLLATLLEVEKSLGRQRTTKWAPRTLDLDILFYGQEIIREEDLIIPHPELHKRRFVLVPLNELASYLLHPVYCVSVAGLLARLEDDAVVEWLEPPRQELRSRWPKE